MTFALAAILLVALALAFVLWPLARSRRLESGGENRSALMRALYRDRVAEIEAEAAAGQLDDVTRSAVVDELGANLLEEYQSAEAAAGETPLRPARGGGRKAFWLMLVLLPVAAAAVYWSVGEPAAPALAGAVEVLRLDPERERSELAAWRDRLARRVEDRPEEGASWYLLGIARLQLGEFDGAADAFGKAHLFLGSDPNVNLYWLQARYLAAGGQMDERSRALAEQILAARPNHPLVLEMFAIDAYRRGDYRTAVEHLNQALNGPMPAAQRAALQGGLEQARKRMQPAGPVVDVAITAPPGAPRDATLFVIASPPGGGMPYAVVRRPADMLPLSVRLDDAVTMSGLKLSNAESFQVIVRLSRSGNPSAAPGDWEWRSPVLTPEDATEPLALEAALAPLEDAGA